MKPALRVPLVLGAIAIGSYLAYNAFHSQTEEDRFQIERARLKREFVERAAVPRGFATDRQKDWIEEVKTLLRWYFDELQAVENRHPGVKTAGLREPEPGKVVRPEDKAVFQVYADYAKRQFDALREGKYEPLWSGADQGLHIDLLSFQPGERPNTKERAIRMDFALWGAPRRVEWEAATRTTRASSRVVVPVVFKDLSFKFYDAQGKLYGGMNGSEPDLKLADPERYVEDFPPGVILGTWYVEPFPAEAVKVEITLTVNVRGMGTSDLVANYKWELPQARDEWKLRPGEVYKAEVRPAP